MTRRSPARFVAPLALLACVIALFTILSNGDSGSGGGATQSTSTRQQTSTTRTTGGRKRTRRHRFYRVKVGDTLAAIADRNGISVDSLYELNPDLDPQALSPGQRVRLRR